MENIQFSRNIDSIELKRIIPMFTLTRLLKRPKTNQESHKETLDFVKLGHNLDTLPK